MNNDEAKRILAAYRPESQDAADPQVSAALQQVERDPALKAWFERHSAFQNSIRESFRQIPVPSDLPDKILRPSNIVTIDAWWQRPVLFATAAGIIILIALSAFWFTRSTEDSLAVFRNRMVGTALREYRMDIVTNDMMQIRQFLTRNRAPADYELTGTLAKLVPVGAGLLSWQGQPVSMVCLDSGEMNKTNVLYLFIVDRSAVARPPTAAPEIKNVNRLTTASWTLGNKVYLLAAPSSAEELKRFF